MNSVRETKQRYHVRPQADETFARPRNVTNVALGALRHAAWSSVAIDRYGDRHEEGFLA